MNCECKYPKPAIANIIYDKDSTEFKGCVTCHKPISTPTEGWLERWKKTRIYQYFPPNEPIYASENRKIIEDATAFITQEKERSYAEGRKQGAKDVGDALFNPLP